MPARWDKWVVAVLKFLTFQAQNLSTATTHTNCPHAFVPGMTNFMNHCKFNTNKWGVVFFAHGKQFTIDR